MTFRRPMCNVFAAIGIVAAVMQANLLPAWAEDGMSVVEQTPKPSQVIDGSAVSFLLRFDRPVDHERSEFVLVTPKGERVIHPRLDSEPNVLYALAGRLAPGSYELRWQASSVDRRTLSGTIPFQVRA